MTSFKALSSRSGVKDVSTWPANFCPGGFVLVEQAFYSPRLFENVLSCPLDLFSPLFVPSFLSSSSRTKLE